ncbi:hypothetical protein [Myxococcus qinghaiensis]|uniref:hypothetical protein n=1 Tax=Myxococcus qinghaiensis TaxID=2906758 RepID=UPI0020A80897|nr:hypothetical protein [Myxococcus qinghaiensis]MCP3167980.1 hypothetical protein [Myxococcus qinghaiensis]
MIISVGQSQTLLPSRGTAQLMVRAQNPQGGRLVFTWTASMGELGTPLHGEDVSEVTWTAPDCIIPGSFPVKVTVTNAQGLSAEMDFSFHVGPTIYDNHQPPFAEGQFESLQNMFLTSDGTLEYQHHAPFALDAERIVAPTDQEVSLTFLSQNALASHSMGWLYYDDVVARGYVDTKGTPDSSDDTLVDTNGNGITDFHEDLYNLAPTGGPQARPYVGRTRRCSRLFDSGGFVYSTPDIAMSAGCSAAFSRGVSLDDARPGRAGELIRADVVGVLAPSTTAPPGSGFSDGGLFSRIPNLLEPAATENGDKGLGNLAFLLTDDDNDRTSFKRLGPVEDRSDFSGDGLPDYDVSAYTPSGLLRATNPDPGMTAFDRTVKLGVHPGWPGDRLLPHRLLRRRTRPGRRRHGVSVSQEGRGWPVHPAPQDLHVRLLLEVALESGPGLPGHHARGRAQPGLRGGYAVHPLRAQQPLRMHPVHDGPAALRLAGLVGP